MQWPLSEGMIEITKEARALCRVTLFALVSRSIYHYIYNGKTPRYLKDSYLVFGYIIIQAEDLDIFIYLCGIHHYRHRFDPSR